MIEMGNIKDILTELNLMSYNLHGSWDTLEWTKAPMYGQRWGNKSRGWRIHSCIERYVKLGVPLLRMNVGLPFYGRLFHGEKGMNKLPPEKGDT